MYVLDFTLMVQLSLLDHTKQRTVRRGRQGERFVRPSDKRFGDNSIFLMGEFRPVMKSTEGNLFDDCE